MWNLKNKKQTHRYRVQIGGCQEAGDLGWGQWVKWVKVVKIHTSGYEISCGDVMYTMVTIVNNNV